MYKRRKPRKKSTTWLTFLRNHVDVSRAIDFFTVTTLRFATLYVFLVFDYGRRKVVHFDVTRRPYWIGRSASLVYPHRRVNGRTTLCGRLNAMRGFPGVS